MAGALARIEGLSYWYPAAERPAMREVDLELGAGLSLVVGRSGGGKSTLLRLLDGLVPQFHGGRVSGSAWVAGLDPLRTPIPRLAASVGLVFQDVETQSVYGTVEREIAFGLENRAMARTEMHGRVDRVLAELSIEHLRGRRLATLSGGERQRVQLAAVLAVGPSIVALDEPTSQLDPEGARAVLAACHRLASAGRAVVVAEHRFETLLPAADRLIAVDEGRVGETTAGALAGAVAAHRPRPFGPAEPAWEMRDVAAGPSGPSGTAVLEGVSLAAAPGEVVALTGANGSGKTTLLRTLAGLTPALSGSVRRPSGRTAYLPQNPATLLYQPTVRAEVELTLRRTGTGSAAEVAALTAEALAAFGLDELADRYPRDLSSGERQRAALAATLAGRPSLVLLDEPTRGMDAAARRALAAAVASLAERGSAVVVATHDADLVAEIADTTIAVGGGGAVAVRATGPGTARQERPGPPVAPPASSTAAGPLALSAAGEDP